MFTGLVEEIGTVTAVHPYGQGRTFSIAAKRVLDGLSVGDSVAVDGVCLTVIEAGTQGFRADAVEETLDRTTLATIRVGDRVNLERSLAAGARLGGHFVQGHIDGTGVIESIAPLSAEHRLTVRLDAGLVNFVVEKGSIAVDGLSLTVAAVKEACIEIAVIPYTWQATTISRKKTGDRVNIEVDILAKYIYKFIRPFKLKAGLTLEKLSQMGYSE